MNLTKHSYSQERGAAVVIALGIFALVLALGLNFASQSIINEKIAQNLDNKTRAELLSTTAMNRLLATISTTSELTESDLYSSGSSDKVDSNDLSDTIENISYNGNPNTAWIYIYNNSDNDEIIGRIAYSFCSAGDQAETNPGGIGKLNAAACVDSGINAANSGTYAVSEDEAINTSIDTSGNPIQGRPGVNVNEIYLAALDPAFTSDSLVLISSVNAEPEGKLPAEGNWIDFATLTKSIGIDSENGKATVINRLAKKLEVSSIPDPEAFWIDDNGDDVVDSDELYHRFNLARTDWDDIRVDSFLNNSPKEFLFTDSDTDGLTIPWLKNWQATGDMLTPENCRNQIIANLIDYCDSNDSATTDDQNNPSYTGNDKTPYINELNIEFEVQATVHKGKHGGASTSQATVTVRNVSMEVVNMYSNSYSKDDILADIEFNYSFIFDGTTYTDTPATTISFPAISDESYTVEDQKSISEVDAYSLNEVTAISDISVYNLKVKLYNNSSGNFLDYSYIDVSGNTYSTALSGDKKKNELYFEYEVNDPRQNLFENSWTCSISTSSSETLGSINTVCILPIDSGETDSDLEETATDPWDVSTVYIRNAAMKSPWELGFIHRGAAWQTINLKKYNTDQGAKTTAGGNTYSDGDANILDQIKMTSNTKTLGKVNLNNPIIDDENGSPLVALFTGINVGVQLSDQDDNPGYPGTITTSFDNALDLSAAIQSKIMTDDNLDTEKMFKTRAEVLENIPEFYDNTLDLSQDNDAKQEEIIGKFINLTKADGKLYNPDNITVLLLSQSIKDAGGKDNAIKINGIDALKGEFEAGVDSILSTTKALVTLSKNPDTGKWEINRFEYIGE